MFSLTDASASSPLFWLCLAVALWPILFVSIVLHEAGHAVLGKLAGYHIGAWGLGVGEPIFVFPSLSRPAKTRFFLCRRQPLNGLTGAIYPGLFPRRRQAATLLLGGALTNLLLALLGLVLAPLTSGIGYPISIACIGVNLLLCLMALLPTRSRGATDGAQLLGLLSSHGTRIRAPVPETRLSHAPLWRAVGATTIVQFEQLSLAVALLEMGAAKEAARYLHDSAPAAPAYLTAYAALVKGMEQEAAGNIAEAQTYFARAEAGYVQMKYGAAANLARLYDAGVNPSRLEALYAASGVEAVPILRTMTAYRLLLALCTDSVPDTGALATVVSRYQSARLAWRSDVQDAIAFTTAAHALRRSGDAAGAESLHKQAQDAIGQVRFALAYHPALMEAFQQHLERRTAGA